MTTASPLQSIGDADMPALFRSADRASAEAQRKYIRLVKADLALIVLSAIASSWAVTAPGLRVCLAIIVAASFIVAMALTAFVRLMRYDQEWFGARAVAESVKTVSWRYMTCAEPYVRSLEDAKADDLFSEEITALLRDRRGVGASLGGIDASGQEITNRMREIRRADLDTRKSVYLHGRIQNQRTWYGNRAARNARLSLYWLTAVGVGQACGALAAVTLVVWPGCVFNIPSVIAALVAALLAWLQLNRHQESAHAYGLAAHELGFIEVKAPHARTEDEFSRFVSDAENAISREHTMWMARRDTI